MSASRPTLRRELAELLALAWPIALAQFGLVGMGLVDTAVLGRVSVPDLAGVAIGRNVAFAVFSVQLGLVMALEPLASQALGAGEPGRAWESLRTASRALAVVWFPTTLAGLAVVRALPLVGMSPEVVARATLFYLGQAPSLFFFGVYLAAKTFLQAHGRTWPALWTSVVANVWNFVLCNLLVRGDDALASAGLPRVGLPALGALGAGLATASASVVLALLIASSARAHRPHASTPAPPVPLRTVLALGVPIGLQLLAEIGVFALVALLAGRFGEDVVSAHQIAIGLASFTFMGALGTSGATAVLVGRAVGAGTSPRRVGLLGIATGVAFMSLGALAFWAFPRALTAAFTDDAGVIAIGAKLVAIAAVFQLVDGVQVVASGALRGAGDVNFPFHANVVAHWLVGFPIAMLLGFHFRMGAPGLWWGLTAGLVTVAAALAARFVVLTRRAIVRVG